MFLRCAPFGWNIGVPYEHVNKTMDTFLQTLAAVLFITAVIYANRDWDRYG